MNVKRYLKKQAKQDRQNLRNSETEEDRAFLEKLKAYVVEEPPKKRRNKQWLWSIPGVAACAVAAVLVGVLVPFPDAGDVKYEETNFVQVDSDFAALSTVLDKLTVRTTQDQTVGVQRTYDSVSGDDLFYTLTVDESSANALYKLTAQIVVNDKYEFNDFMVTENFVTEVYADYSVSFHQRVDPDPDTGLNLVRCDAKVSGGSYDIYIIGYEEYSLENGTFLTVIDNLFDFG